MSALPLPPPSGPAAVALAAAMPPAARQVRKLANLRAELLRHFTASLTAIEITDGSPHAITNVEATQSAQDAEVRENVFASLLLEAEDVGDALEAIVAAEEEEEREKRLYEARVALAASHSRRTYAILMPLILAWCERNRPAKGVTWKFPTTLHRIQDKQTQARLEVQDHDAAIDSLREVFGYDGAEELTRVKIEASASKTLEKIRDLGEAGAAITAKLRGFRFTPQGKKMTIVRSRSEP